MQLVESFRGIYTFTYVIWNLCRQELKNRCIFAILLRKYLTFSCCNKTTKSCAYITAEICFPPYFSHYPVMVWGKAFVSCLINSYLSQKTCVGKFSVTVRNTILGHLVPYKNLYIPSGYLLHKILNNWPLYYATKKIWFDKDFNKRTSF